MSKGTIKDFRIKVIPSKELVDFLKKHVNEIISGIPENVVKILANSGYEMPSQIEILKEETCKQSFNNKIDFELLKTICPNSVIDNSEYDENHSGQSGTKIQNLNEEYSKCKNFLYLSDIKWFKEAITQLRSDKRVTCFMHQMLEGCAIILPENEIIERNPVLEARCQRLREEQENRAYQKMTKNVDSALKNYPEDTISYQLKSINRQIVAVLQFVFSVVAGFVFGFLGVELIVGNLDFGFRLLLGIMCALIIALAEIYFLAKQLNELDDAATDPPPTNSPNHKNKVHTD